MSHETIPFQDLSENQDGLLVVRTLGVNVGIALSLVHCGDVEAVFDRQTARKLIDTLENAISGRGQGKN